MRIAGGSIQDKIRLHEAPTVIDKADSNSCRIISANNLDRLTIGN